MVTCFMAPERAVNSNWGIPPDRMIGSRLWEILPLTAPLTSSTWVIWPPEHISCSITPARFLDNGVQLGAIPAGFAAQLDFSTINEVNLIVTSSDTTPPVFTVCPAGQDLGCNPGSLPDCASVSAQVQTTDDSGGPVTLHCTSADTTSGCT